MSRKLLCVSIALIALMMLSPLACIANKYSPPMDVSAGVSEIKPLSAETPNGTRFVSATVGLPFSLDPAVDYETAGAEIIQNVYETLVWYDNDSAVNLKPMLATEVPTIENAGVSADGLNYTFHIRTNVTFHDWTPLTAQDVEFSLERVLRINDPSGPAWMLGQVLIPNYYGSFPVPNSDDINNAVTVVDNYTVVIHLQHQYPAFLQVLATPVGSIVSKAYVMANGGVVEGERNEWMQTHACGTGPFYLNWTDSTGTGLVHFWNYWRGPASLEYVDVMTVPDIGTREMMLFSGDADTAYIDRQHKTDVQGVEGLRISQGAGTFNIDFIGMNQDIKPSDLDIGDIPSNFFSDIHVRRAFAAAFDDTAFIQNTLNGSGIQPNGPIPQGMWGYNSSVPKYQFNIQTVIDEMQLAKDARTADPDDTFYDNGFNLTIYYNEGNTVRQAAVERLAAGLNVALPGKVTVSAVGLEWGTTYLPAMYAGQLTCFMLGWAPDYADPDDYVIPFLLGNSTYSTMVGLNNNSLNSLITSASAELNDSARAQMYYNISMDCYENAYYIWTDQATQFHVERDWVQGYYFNPMFGGLYYYDLSKPPTGNSEYLSIWSPSTGTRTSDNSTLVVGNAAVPSTVTVNGIDASVDSESGNWSAFVPLEMGVNVITASSVWNGTDNFTVSIIITREGPLGVPTNLQASAGYYSVLLSWSYPYGVNATPDGFLVYRGMEPGNESFLADVGNSLTYADPWVAMGQTYYYRVSAYVYGTEGGLSEEVNATPTATVPSSPESPWAEGGNEVISLYWWPPWYNGGSDITGYDVYRGIASGEEVFLASTSNTSYVDEDVEPGVQYYYYVTAVNSIGSSNPSYEIGPVWAYATLSIDLQTEPDSESILGEAVSLSGEIKTSDGTGVGGLWINIYFVLNGQYLQTLPVTSSPDGSFSLQWLPTVTGNYTIMAYFNGDANYYYTWNNTNITVAFNPSSTDQRLDELNARLDALSALLNETITNVTKAMDLVDEIDAALDQTNAAQELTIEQLNEMVDRVALLKNSLSDLHDSLNSTVSDLNLTQEQTAEISGSLDQTMERLDQVTEQLNDTKGQLKATKKDVSSIQGDLLPLIVGSIALVFAIIAVFLFATRKK